MAISTSGMNYPFVNVIWKNFVRETSAETAKVTSSNSSQLNFRGNEAKIVYEEIINANKVEADVADNVTKRENVKEISRFVRNENNKKCKKYIRNCYSKANNIKIDANKILKAVEQGDIEFLKDNLTNDNVNIADYYGWTPLMSAAYCGNEIIMKFLLKLGANRELKDKCGFTALQLAQKKNQLKSIHLLKSKKLFEMKQKKSPKDLEIIEFYCSICKATFRETNVQKHESSTLHIFNTNPKLPDPIYGISTQNKGYQIMVNNGWEESKGLGPSGNGLKYPVKTVLKRDRKGLGHKPNVQAKITHFKSGDTNAIRHIKQLKVNTYNKNPVRKGDCNKIKTRERRKEIAIRRALS